MLLPPHNFDSSPTFSWPSFLFLFLFFSFFSFSFSFLCFVLHAKIPPLPLFLDFLEEPKGKERGETMVRHPKQSSASKLSSQSNVLPLPLPLPFLILLSPYLCPPSHSPSSSSSSFPFLPFVHPNPEVQGNELCLRIRLPPAWVC